MIMLIFVTRIIGICQHGSFINGPSPCLGCLTYSHFLGVVSISYPETLIPLLVPIKTLVPV